MNKDQVKGTVKDIAGKVQEKTGELTGSETQQIKGMKNQVEGKIQKGVGDAKEAIRRRRPSRRAARSPPLRNRRTPRCRGVFVRLDLHSREA